MAPTVSVVILTFNEERNIGEALGALARQSLPRDEFEVLVVDSASTDRTREIVESHEDRFSRLLILDCPQKNIARCRNEGWKKARGRYVAYTDADCIVSERWLEGLLEPFRREGGIAGLAATGGGNCPPDGSRLMGALKITLNSFWGSHGSAQGIRFKEEVLVPHIPTCNILYERRTLAGLGGFDESFARVCEDAELNHRLTRSGKKILFVPGAEVIHKVRGSLRKWLRNVYLYGFGRGRILRKHPSHLSAKFLVPPLIVAGLSCALLLSPLLPSLIAIPIGYALFVLAIGLFLSLKEGALGCLWHVFAVLACQPLAYGIGEIVGALRGPHPLGLESLSAESSQVQSSKIPNAVTE